MPSRTLMKSTKRFLFLFSFKTMKSHFGAIPHTHYSSHEGVVERRNGKITSHVTGDEAQFGVRNHESIFHKQWETHLFGCQNKLQFDRTSPVCMECVFRFGSWHASFGTIWPHTTYSRGHHNTLNYASVEWLGHLTRTNFGHVGPHSKLIARIYRSFHGTLWHVPGNVRADADVCVFVFIVDGSSTGPRITIIIFQN